MSNKIHDVVSPGVVSGKGTQDIFAIGQYYVAFSIGLHIFMIKSHKIAHQLNVSFIDQNISSGVVFIQILIIIDLIGLQLPRSTLILDYIFKCIRCGRTP